MNSINKYLQSARNESRERMIGIDGTIDDSMYYTDDPVFSADGNGAEMAQTAQVSAPQSQPYIITVSNASASAVSNFDVLGAFEYLQNTGFSNGSLTINGVTISSNIPNVTYQQFLYQSQAMPFSVGMTYYSSASGSANQVLQPFTIVTKDANGNEAKRLIVPLLDPYQQQTGVTIVKQGYSIDGNTKLTFSQVLGSAVFQLYFFPSDNINTARGLRGTPVSRQFGSPNVVKSSIAVVNGETVKARLG